MIRPVNKMLTALKVKEEDKKKGLLILKNQIQDRFIVIDCCENDQNIKSGSIIICCNWQYMYNFSTDNEIYIIRLDQVLAVEE